MINEISDPFIGTVIVFIGSLVLGILVGGIDGYVYKGTGSTVSMKIGVYAVAGIFLGTMLSDSRRKMIASVRTGTFTKPQRIVMSMAYCWLLFGILGFITFAIFEGVMK